MDLKSIEQSLLHFFPEDQFKVTDLTGTGDHIQIEIQSEQFRGKSLVKQHQMVYQALGNRMKKEIHAVVIKTSVPK